MKAKKGICSSDCECLTITGWKCYAEEHLCNCGDWGSTPPVPPTPTTYTYGLEKQTTRGDKVTYTATKTKDWESNPESVYELYVEFYDNYEGIDDLKIWDCTNECVWTESAIRWPFDETELYTKAYIDNTEAALISWTQAAFKSIYDAYKEFCTYDNDYVYDAEKLNTDLELWDVYIFEKNSKWEHSEPSEAYSLSLIYNGSWELTEAQISYGDGSWNWEPIQDSSQALALKSTYDALVANPSQAAAKSALDDARTLYNSLQ